MTNPKGEHRVNRVAALEGLQVVDFAAGMADALIAKFVAELGATVRRIPPERGDPFVDVYPAYRMWQCGQLIEGAARGSAREQSLLREADICIIGGEDYPGMMLRHDAEDLLVEFPRLVILHITASNDLHPGRSLPAVDILAQARSGVVFELAESEPMLMSFQPANYGVSLQSLTGLGAALFARESTGQGQIVSVNFDDGARTWVQCVWGEAEKSSPEFEFAPPKDAEPIICCCRDGIYVHIVLGAFGSKAKLYKVLGINDPTVADGDAGLPSLKNGPRQYFGDVDLLKNHISRRDSTELLAALREVGVVVEPVLPPGICWELPQVGFNKVLTTARSDEVFVANPITWNFPAAGKLAAESRSLNVLSDARVVDFGAFVAGPIASIALTDLGADVIKVEPLGGEPFRAAYRFYSACNRGKRVISIDMKTPDGMALARRLCARADIVCSNFRVGVATRLGIDAETIHRRQPRCIVLHNAGYGVGGPQVDSPAFDPVMQALCGHEYRMGGAGNEPRINRCMPIDLAGGLLGSALLLLALYKRKKTGVGAELIVPLLNAGVFLMSELIRRPDGQFAGGEPLAGDRRGFRPTEKIYETTDGWVAIAARSDAMANDMAAALGLAGLLKDGATAWGAAETEVISAAIRSQSTESVMRLLEERGVWCEPCLRGAERATLHDPSLRTRGTVYCARHLNFGKVAGLGLLFGLSALHARPRGETASSGEHTRQILTELGVVPGEIESLYNRRIVA